MSDSIHPLSPAIGPNLPELEADLDSPSTLPSSLPYETWAASCPEYNRDIEIYGRIVELHAKKCAFCAKEIRLGPGGDGALVQHMLSNQCRAIQWELEKEILGIAETDEDEMAFDLASILVPDDPPNIASHVSNISNTEMPSQTCCQGAGMTVSTSLWANYPWHLHDLDHSASPPFTICSIDPTGTIIRIRSNACASIVSQPSQQSCGPCARQLKSLELKQIFKRVTSGTCDNGLNLRYCSHKQLAKHVETKEETIKKYRLQGIQANRDTRRLIGKLNDQKQFMLAIAASDDDGVGRLVRVALNQGASAAAIVDRLRQAQEGLYHCRSYTKKSLDMALLSLRLAGPRMLYALSKASNFPSLSTVYRNGERTYLRPSIAFPTADEVLSNIKSVCGKASKSCMRGFTLMIDEIALEERPRYSYAEDAIVGICREHANKCDTRKMTGRPISHLMELKKLLDSGECHRAKEATLVALAPFGQLDYTPMVVLISGTCKTELVDKQRDLIMLVLKAWAMSPWGQLLLGLIWSIATDGDGRRRQALHYICMSQTLHPSSPIYPELSQLALLNLCCGEGEVTHDGDFKHEEKRLASALRSNAGIFVNGTHITPQIIKRHLRCVPSLLHTRINALFDGSDCQNVPKAHSLLKGIYDASRLPEVRSKADNQEFVLLGEFLYSFYAPHTTPSMSLSQQVVCLSKCAFMLFGLFRVDGTAFISSQLYYDTQASIKNALFCIAKTKALDPSRPFYLLQLGDDRLEGLFGVYRTTTNNCNPDLLGMAERSGAAQEVNNILAEHPDCDRKPYRLSLEGALGVDHLNPASWTGDVCVGNVSLRTSWDEGLSQARVSLSRVGIVLDCNPDNLRAAAGGRDVDLMRPWGHYIGVSEPQLGETDTRSSTLVESVPNSSLCPQPNPNGTPNPNSEIINPPADDLSLMDAELPFEELLDPCMPAASEDHVHVPDGPIERGWVQVTEARKIRLESATRLILGTESSEKSTDRLRRVRGFSCYPSATPQSDSILGDFCLVGQPVLGLVRTPHEIALAAVKITSINVSTGTQSSQVESISLEHLNRSDVTLRGQILALEFHDGKWYWNRSYVTTPAKGGKTIAPKAKNLKPLLVDYKACMIEPVNPSLVEREEGLVWSFEHDELVGSTDLLWSKSLANLHSIPMITSSPGFPYQSGNNTHTHTLIHLEASQAIEAMPAERCGLCHLCGYSVPIRHFMRTHIAKHIRAKQRGIEDPLVHGPIGPAACGFCGRSGCCKTLLKVSKKSTSLSSDCEYFDKFSLEPAAKSTNSSPCTNRPIACQHNECLDRDPIWSYNMRGHILARHGESAFNHAVNTGLFMITPQEDKRLQLDNMLMVPGKSPFSLSPPPAVSAKRKINDSSVIGEQATSPIITHSPALTDTSPGASGSQSKRPRLV